VRHEKLVPEEPIKRLHYEVFSLRELSNLESERRCECLRNGYFVALPTPFFKSLRGRYPRNRPIDE